MKQNLYTIEDCGCYVDGARGIYATDAIVAFANAHGANIVHDEDCDNHADTSRESTFAGCEFAGDYEDEADAWMNEHYAVDGAYWGRNENGDWGLWATDEDEYFEGE